jgi:hypothetical protein
MFSLLTNGTQLLRSPIKILEHIIGKACTCVEVLQEGTQTGDKGMCAFNTSAFFTTSWLIMPFTVGFGYCNNDIHS